MTVSGKQLHAAFLWHTISDGIEDCSLSNAKSSATGWQLKFTTVISANNSQLLFFLSAGFSPSLVSALQSHEQAVKLG